MGSDYKTSTVGVAQRSPRDNGRQEISMEIQSQDPSKPFFGREADITKLYERVKRRGITAVVGRPMMGKSRLLAEFASQLDSDSKLQSRRTFLIPGIMLSNCYLVGFFQTAGESSDVLLRAVENLYTRWLSNLEFSKQAQIVWRQQKKDFIGKVGQAVGTIFEKISKLGTHTLSAVGAVVKETLDGLVAANRELLSGGLQLPRLQSDQARELVSLVTSISRMPIVLILDQWEKSPAIQSEANSLESFLQRIDEWPSCHIILSLHVVGEASMITKRLRDRYTEAFYIHLLPPMHLDDHETQSALLAYLRKEIKITNELADGELIRMISGYPGVIDRWIAFNRHRTIKSSEDLEQLAIDANDYRFGEFNDLLPMLPERQRHLSMRIVLLPGIAEEADWQALKKIAIGSATNADLDSLAQKEVLASVDPPNYGHQKRNEAVFHWFVSRCRLEVREICESLIFNLADLVREASPQEAPFISHLAMLEPFSKAFQLSTLTQVLCEIAASLYGKNSLSVDSLTGAADEEINSKAHPSLAPILAIGFRTMIDIERIKKEEQASNEGAHLGGMDSGFQPPLSSESREGALSGRLLLGLTKLSTAFPEAATIRHLLGEAIYNEALSSEQDKRLELLEQLRQLSNATQPNSIIPALLAKLWFNDFTDGVWMWSVFRGDRNTPLDELRALTFQHPDDMDVRGVLAKALGYMVVETSMEDERPDQWATELEALGQSYPHDQNISDLLRSFRMARESYNLSAEDESRL
jgi:hypothetical protein